VFAQMLARNFHRKCWSVELDDLEAAALGGYVTAQRRFTPPGDFGKYARAYMRGAVLEVLRQEAKAHGLVRSHTRRCRKCKEPMAHRDKLHPNTRYCDTCRPKAEKEQKRVTDARRWVHHHGNRCCAECHHRMPIGQRRKYCTTCGDPKHRQSMRWRRYYRKHAEKLLAWKKVRHGGPQFTVGEINASASESVAPDSQLCQVA